MMEDLPFFCGRGWDFSLCLEEEFEGASVVILRLISFELWNSLDCTMPSYRKFAPFRAFYRTVALCVILRDSSSLVSLFLFVTSAKNFILRTLSSSCRAVCFKMYIKIFFKMAGSGLAPASEDVRSLTVLWSGSKYYVCLFTATEWGLVLLRLKLPGTWKHVPSWDGYEFDVWFSFVYALLDSVSYGSWAVVEEKTPKYSSKWTLNVGNFLWSRSSAEGAHYHHSETWIN